MGIDLISSTESPRQAKDLEDEAEEFERKAKKYTPRPEIYESE